MAERAAANRVAFLDRKTLSSAYTDEFYESALASGEVLLMCSAMANMAMVGRATTCYEALRANSDPRAPALLARARSELLARAAQIAEPEARKRFLEVAAHRELLAAEG